MVPFLITAAEYSKTVQILYIISFWPSVDGVCDLWVMWVCMCMYVYIYIYVCVCVFVCVCLCVCCFYVDVW
jgi:hypothetical protein